MLLTTVEYILVMQVGKPSQCISQYPLSGTVRKTLFLGYFQKDIGQVRVEKEEVVGDRVHHSSQVRTVCKGPLQVKVVFELGVEDVLCHIFLVVLCAKCSY